MTREEAKELLPIIQAFAEGKTIQIKKEGDWIEVGENTEVYFSESLSDYRIKPEPKYRPFKNQEECWEEMQKHQPFGWIRSNVSGILYLIESVSDEIHFNRTFVSYEDAFECSEFIDGTPFGIKDE